MNNRTRMRKVTLWLSLGVIAFAVIATLVIMFVPSDNPAVPGPGPGPGTEPGAQPPAPPEVSVAGCKSPASDNREVPNDLRWEASQGITWPVSDTVGPTATTKGFPACFEHSPIGAALAAVTYLYSQVDHSPLESGEFYIVDSPGKEAALAGVDADTPSKLKAQLAENGVSLVGFQVEEYGSDRAAVRLVLRFPSSATGLRGLPFPMVWVDSDWRLKPLDSGSTGQATDVRPDDFTYWTGAGNG